MLPSSAAAVPTHIDDRGPRSHACTNIPLPWLQQWLTPLASQCHSQRCLALAAQAPQAWGSASGSQHAALCELSLERTFAARTPCLAPLLYGTPAIPVPKDLPPQTCAIPVPLRRREHWRRSEVFLERRHPIRSARSGQRRPRRGLVRPDASASSFAANCCGRSVCEGRSPMLLDHIVHIFRCACHMPGVRCRLRQRHKAAPARGPSKPRSATFHGHCAGRPAQADHTAVPHSQLQLASHVGGAARGRLGPEVLQLQRQDVSAWLRVSTTCGQNRCTSGGICLHMYLW